MENTPQKMVKTGAEKLGNRTSTVREINDLVAPVEPKNGTTYGDMTVAEYNSVIATRERIAANCAEHKYEQREVEEAEKHDKIILGSMI